MAYDSSNLTEATLSGRIDIVRFYIGDTATVQRLTDDEISFHLTTSNDRTLPAAALAASTLAAKYAHLVDVELEGILAESYSQLAKQYNALFYKLKAQAASDDLGLKLPPTITTTTPEFTVDQFENPDSGTAEVTESDLYV